MLPHRTPFSAPPLLRIALSLVVVGTTGLACNSPTSPTSTATTPLDTVRITSITPEENLAVDHEMRFVIKVAYELVNASTATLEIAVNDESPSWFRSAATRSVMGASGDIEVVFKATPRDWGNEAVFALRVSLNLIDQTNQSRSHSDSRPLQLYVDRTGNRKAVETQHLRNLRYFLSADADNFASAFSTDAVDWGGGSTGTGQLPPEYFTAQYWEELFSAPEFKDLVAGRSIDDFIVVEKNRAFARPEMEAMGGISNTIFSMLDGDMVVMAPAAESSPFSDGWFTVYRKVGSQWKIVAID